MQPIDVVCAIIRKEGNIFIARRGPEKSLQGTWEFPGGKVEAGEDPATALARELREELDMEITNAVWFGAHTHAYDAFTIHLIAFTCRFVHSSFRMTDHDAYAFVRPDELHQYQMAAADRHFVEMLAGHK